MAYLNIDAKVECVASYLSSSSIYVTREWLTGCIQYFEAENLNSSIAETKQFVLKQWELSDLRESSSGCLPNNLKSQTKITLRQKYALQVESVINISSSAYSQIQKIRKADTENVEVTEKKPEAWEPKPGRMLKMKLCDGVQDVEAIEYQPLHMINENITPGTKVIIMGPVDCRRGIFFLKPANLKVIGGEVDSMLIVNHLENVLARTLNLPENEDPFATHTQETRSLPSDTSNGDSFSGRKVFDHVQNHPVRSINSRPTCNRTEQSNFTSISVNRREQELCSDIVDLDVSGWEDDDLFLEYNEEFSEPREPNTDVHQSMRIGNTSTNSKIPHSNMTGLKGNTVCGVTKRAEIKVVNTNTNQSRPSRNDSTVSNVGGSILASDEYVDSMLLDEWDEAEMVSECNNEFFYATSSKSQITSSVAVSENSVNKTASSLTNSTNNNIPFNHLKVPSHPSKHQPFVEAPKNIKHAQIQKAGLSNWLKKSSDPTISKSSSPSQALVNPLATSSLKPLQCSYTNAGSTTDSNHSPKHSLSMKRPMLQSDFNISKKMRETDHKKSKPTISDDSLDLSNCSKTFDDEEDWAEAYINRQNFSFVNKLNDSGDTKINFTESPLQISAPQSGNGSTKKNYGKEDMPLFNNTRNDVQLPNKVNLTQQESFSSHRKPQSHLPAAFCSPSDIKNDMDVFLVESDGMEMDSSVFAEACVSSTKQGRKSMNTSLDSSVKPRSEPSWSCPIKSSSPFEYLLHILHPSPKVNGIHKVKGTILSLLSQLKVDADSGWHLSAKICDGTGTLDVDFTSDVLDHVIGLSHQEFKQMKREASRNPLVKEKLVKLLQDARQKMIDLNCIFTVKFEEGKKAYVINISDVTQQDVNKMKLRLSSL